MAYVPKTPRTKMPSAAAKARGAAALKRARAAREATRNTPSSTSSRTNRSMNALDTAISQGKTLPSRNTKIPGDTDVSMKGFRKKPVIRIKKK